MYTHVPIRIIHNSQKVEATQASIDRWIDKMCLHTVGSDTCYNIDEPWKQYAKVK